jgi:hypothetical protein
MLTGVARHWLTHHYRSQAMLKPKVILTLSEVLKLCVVTGIAHGKQT